VLLTGFGISILNKMCGSTWRHNMQKLCTSVCQNMTHFWFELQEHSQTMLVGAANFFWVAASGAIVVSIPN